MFADDSGYELTDPKHPSYHDRMSSLADQRRKTAREANPETVAHLEFRWNHYIRSGEATQGSGSGRPRMIRMQTAIAGKTWYCENCGAAIAAGELHWTNDYQPQDDRICIRCGEGEATNG